MTRVGWHAQGTDDAVATMTAQDKASLGALHFVVACSAVLSWHHCLRCAGVSYSVKPRRKIDAAYWKALERKSAMAALEDVESQAKDLEGWSLCARVMMEAVVTRITNRSPVACPCRGACAACALGQRQSRHCEWCWGAVPCPSRSAGRRNLPLQVRVCALVALSCGRHAVSTAVTASQGVVVGEETPT